MTGEVEPYRFVAPTVETDEVRLVRAVSTADGRAVLLKQLRLAAASASVASLEAELALLRSLHVPGIVQPIGLTDLARGGDVSILSKPFTPTGLLESVHGELARTART